MQKYSLVSRFQLEFYLFMFFQAFEQKWLIVLIRITTHVAMVVSGLNVDAFECVTSAVAFINSFLLPLSVLIVIVVQLMAIKIQNFTA